MAFHYVAGDRNQLFLLPVSMRDWLDEGHLAWFVLDVVDQIDTKAFHARHANDGPGRPAYNPDMMLALVIYAYGMGVRSSRRIEALCHTDAAFRVIAGGATPDHTTIARFLADHEAAIEEAFVGVLRLCAAAGLASVGTIAIDGTKVGTDAALDANRTRETIVAELDRLRATAKQVLADARATDAAEDAAEALFSLDRLPVELGTRTTRRARLEAALAAIEAEDAAEREAAAERAAKAAAAADEGRKLQGRKPTKDPHARLARAEADLRAVRTRADAARAERAAAEAQALAEGRRLRGRPRGDDLGQRDRQALERAERELATAKAAVEAATPRQRQANVTDPESRMMKTAGGWVQGYNAQAAVNEHQVVIACAVSQDANDVNQFTPMLEAVAKTRAAAGVAETVGMVLADAGYWSEDNATAEGPPRLIATQKDWKQRRAAREAGTTTGPPPDDASALEAMEHRLRTPEGAQAYARRSCTIEPVFGANKETRGWRRFRRRGLAAAQSEWALMNLTHNVAKLFKHQAAVRPALA